MLHVLFLKAPITISSQCTWIYRPLYRITIYVCQFSISNYKRGCDDPATI